MPEDWAAVANAIDARLAELNWRQRELAERAQVAYAKLSLKKYSPIAARNEDKKVCNGLR